jgi:putative ABC transport system permease protein
MFDDLRFRLRVLFRRNAVEVELAEELRYHFDRQVEKYMMAGMTSEEAHRRARIYFGGEEQVKENCREARGVHLLETSVQDVRYGFRSMCKNRSFTTIAILTIAVGIAAKVSVYSFLNALFLQSVPAKDPSHLVRILRTSPHGDGDGFFSYPEYAYLREHSETLGTVMAHYSTAPFYVTAADQSLEVQGGVVSGNYFSMLGLRPVIGRFFDAREDEVADRDSVAVVSYTFWKRIYQGDPDVIGKSLIINGRTFDIIGVAPEKFYGVEIGATPNEIWIPTMMVHAGYRWCDALQPNCTIFGVVARLKPG